MHFTTTGSAPLSPDSGVSYKGIISMPDQVLIEWVSLIKDDLLGIAAIVMMFVAVYGLRTWKRELVGKEIYAAARVLVKKATWLAKRRINFGNHSGLTKNASLLKRKLSSQQRLKDGGCQKLKVIRKKSVSIRQN